MRNMRRDQFEEGVVLVLEFIPSCYRVRHKYEIPMLASPNLISCCPGSAHTHGMADVITFRPI